MGDGDRTGRRAVSVLELRPGPGWWAFERGGRGCPPGEAEDLVAESERFIRRAADFMASAGIRQFLRVGRGLTPGPDVQQPVMGIGPIRMLYVDSNPMIPALARTLWGSGEESGCVIDYVHGDLVGPRAWPDVLAPTTFDLTEPVGVLLGSVLHLVPDREDPYGGVRRLVRALAPGSYLAVSHFTHEYRAPALARGVRICERSGVPVRLRTRVEVARFFAGLHLLVPGIELASLWRRGAHEEPPPAPERVACLAGVGVVPHHGQPESARGLDPGPPAGSH